MFLSLLCLFYSSSVGFYTAFSASILLYTSLGSQEDSQEERKFLCSCEISLKLLVVYSWFNSFNYMILFREITIFYIHIPQYSCIIYPEFLTSKIHPGEPWIWSGYKGILSSQQAAL